MVNVKPQLIIADAHVICRVGLRTLVETQTNLAVCGETDSALKVQQLVAQLQPDALICGLQLNQGSGLHVIHGVHAQFPQLPILVVSMYDEALFAERCIRAGAMGFIHKSAPAKQIVAAVRTILQHKLYFSPTLAEQLLRAHLQGHSPEFMPSESKLSDREMEVYLLLGQGQTTKHIANQLHLSPKTIDSHREHIKEKLGIRDNSKLIRRAIAWANNWELNDSHDPTRGIPQHQQLS